MMRQLAKGILKAALPTATYIQLNASIAVKDILARRYAESELELLPKLVPSGTCAVDIGANHGLYAYYLSLAVGAQGNVHAFEPIPQTFETLRATIEKMGVGNVVLHRVACGEKEQMADFVIPKRRGVLESALAYQVVGKDPNASVIKCPLRRLDDELHDVRSVSFIKVDVEGAELHALRGAEGILARDLPLILCEAESRWMQRFGITFEHLRCYLARFGYLAHHYHLGELVRTESISEGNCLFVPENRLINRR